MFGFYLVVDEGDGGGNKMCLNIIIFSMFCGATNGNCIVNFISFLIIISALGQNR